jgi:hypothetical protein
MEETDTSPLAKFDRWEVPTEPVRRFTVDEYHRLLKLGFFAEDELFELLEGWIVPKVRKSPPHCNVVCELDRLLLFNLPEPWLFRCQPPITLADSEPEPDRAIVVGPQSRYRGRHPYAADVAVVIEVADGSLHRARGIKRRIYARAAIATYWIVNVEAECIEVYTDPDATRGTYGRCENFRIGDQVPLAHDGARLAEVRVEDLLPA